MGGENPTPAPEQEVPPVDINAFDMPDINAPNFDTAALNWLNAKGLIIDPNLQLALLSSKDAQAQQSFVSWNASQLAARQAWDAQQRSEEMFAARQRAKDAADSAFTAQQSAYNQALASNYKRRDGNNATIDFVSVQPTLYEQSLQSGQTTATNTEVLGASVAAVTEMLGVSVAAVAEYARIVSQMDANAIVAFAAAVKSATATLEAVASEVEK